jgi:hypothetical protein
MTEPDHMKPKVYLETTISSYLAAWPSRDLVTAAHQQITHEWWQDRRDEFDLFVSQLVLQEASAGDPDAAARRLAFLDDLPLLEQNEEAVALAEVLVAAIPLPERAAADALHIAIATVHSVDYLVTWNCTHIANARLRGSVEAICRSHGYQPPIICTPVELRED